MQRPCTVLMYYAGRESKGKRLYFVELYWDFSDTKVVLNLILFGNWEPSVFCQKLTSADTDRKCSLLMKIHTDHVHEFSAGSQVIKKFSRKS